MTDQNGGKIMIEDIRYVDTRVVKCDGNGSNTDGLGHPSIYLNVGKDGKVECPYCSRIFLFEGKSDDSH